MTWLKRRKQDFHGSLFSSRDFLARKRRLWRSLIAFSSNIQWYWGLLLHDHYILPLGKRLWPILQSLISTKPVVTTRWCSIKIKVLISEWLYIHCLLAFPTTKLCKPYLIRAFPAKIQTASLSQLSQLFQLECSPWHMLAIIFLH